MSAAMNGHHLRRGAGGNRALHFAVLASLVVHAALLLVSLEGKGRRDAEAQGPIVARLVAPPAPAEAPAPAAPAPPTPKPEPAKPRAPEQPKPPQAVAKPALKPPPVAKPKPAPVPRPAEAPASPAPEPQAPSPPAGAEPPRVSAPVAPGGPAPEAGKESGPIRSAPAGDAGSLELYRVQLIAMMGRYKRYPRVALDNNWEGTAVVRMVVGANGRIASLTVATSSGHDVLDKQALDMIRKAKPLVPIPSALRGREVAVEIPVIFNLKDQGSG